MRGLLGGDEWTELDKTIQPEWDRAASIATAIGMLTVAVATFTLSFRDVDSPVLLGVLLVMAAAPTVVQCKRPIGTGLMLGLTLAPLVLLHLFGGVLGTYSENESADQTSLMLLVWLVGQTTSVGRPRHVAIVLTAATAITLGRIFTDDRYDSGPIWLAGIGIALLAGLFIRSLIVTIATSKMAQDAMAEQATTAERQRIAREVHDVIAHSLTVTMLHINAARLAVGRGDTAGATEALEEAERAGRTSLNEIRHTVGLLRTDGDAETRSPQPSAPDVEALIGGYRAAGMDVDLVVTGALEQVTPTAGQALYRIVQESLTNVSRHSPGARATVRVDVGPPLAVDVTSSGGAPPNGNKNGNGLGLVGMSERAAALGGHLVAGEHGDGWRVAATLP